MTTPLTPSFSNLLNNFEFVEDSSLYPKFDYILPLSWSKTITSFNEKTLTDVRVSTSSLILSFLYRQEWEKDKNSSLQTYCVIPDLTWDQPTGKPLKKDP